MNKIRHEVRAHHANPYEDSCIRLYFVGDMLCTRHSEIGYHRNPGYEFCLIPSGRGLFKIDTYAIPDHLDESPHVAVPATRTDVALFPVEKDQLFLTKRHQVHGGWPSADAPFRILYLCLEIKGGIGCGDAFWQDAARRLDAVEGPVCPDQEGMRWIHERLMQEASSSHGEDLEHAAVMQSLLRLFVLLFLRNAARARKVDRMPPSSMAIIRYLDGHLTEEMHLSHIAAAHHMSVSALSRRFRRETGFSVMEYCHMARLEKARHLLATTTGTVSEIAGILRFGSIHHFSHAFKAMYGITPSAHRKAVARQASVNHHTVETP